MHANDATRKLRQTGAGDIDGENAEIVSIRPRARTLEKLRAVGLSVELKHIGRYVMPIITTERPLT